MSTASLLCLDSFDDGHDVGSDCDHDASCYKSFYVLDARLSKLWLLF